ncbi:MAG: Mu transposase C-terminal domain-containing protein [Chiayiivirga sp.]|jgi:putative transposase|nr:Mu transposase C-terminal domain-containing protein [Chiayiivirga sp.]
MTATIKASGSPVIELSVGRVYALADRPGTYTIMQFETAEDVTVREGGSGALLSIKVSQLRPLVASENTRDVDLKKQDEQKRKKAEDRLAAIKPLLDFRRIPSSELEKRAAEVGQSPKTLRKWVRRYRKDPRLSSLGRKRRSDVSKSRFDVAIEKEIAGAVKQLLKDGNLTLKDVHKDLIDEVDKLAARMGWKKWRKPSYGTLYDRYLKVSEKDKAEAKFGPRPARLKHGISRGSMLDLDHPLAIVQVDHLEMPVVVVDEETRIPIGKAWITVLIDLFSRCIVGYYVTLEAPSNLSLGLAMTHAILPKDDTLKLLGFKATWPICGFMWAIHADNAGEFHGNMLELAAQEYGFELLFRKVRQPQYGGHIESYLGTLSEKLRILPGSTREGPESLGETDPNESAAMTLKELERYIVSLIVEYHNAPHSGLHDVTPLAKFAEGMRGAPGVLPMGTLRQAADPERLRLDFLPCDERTVQSDGITWDYIHYVDDCLQRWVNSLDPKNIHEKRKFLVRRDPRDISRIYFFDPELNVYRIIGTRNLSRPAMSLWELKAAIKFLREKGHTQIDEDLIFAARAERQEIRTKAISKTQAAKRERARQEQRERDWKSASAPAVDPQPKPSGAPVPTGTEAGNDAAAETLPEAVIGKRYQSSW